jgi:hypothetical protein
MKADGKFVAEVKGKSTPSRLDQLLGQHDAKLGFIRVSRAVIGEAK